MDALTAPRHLLPPCGGRTWFEALVEGWHDQAMLRLHLDSLHGLELVRVAQPPPIEVTVASHRSPVSSYRIDPNARTVTYTIARSADRVGDPRR